MVETKSQHTDRRVQGQPTRSGTRDRLNRRVARSLDVPKVTLYGWRYRGKGPRSHRVGKHIRYRWSDVLDWIDKID